MLETHSIYKNFGANSIFEDVSFSINDKDKVALVGENGAGKSTILKIISGRVSIDSGNINKSDSLRINYLDQEIDLNKYKTIEDYYNDLLKGSAEQNKHKLFKLFNVFDIKHLTLETELEKLSGGQLNKVAMSVFFVKPSDVLLLDEPTNNLDIKTITTLQNLLKKTPKSCVISSHDRELMESVCTKVFEVEDKKVVIHSCEYKNFLKKKKDEEKRKLDEYNKYLIKKREIEKKVEKSQDIADTEFNLAIDTKQKHEGDARRTEKKDRQATQIAKRLDKLEEVEEPEEAKHIEYEIQTKNVEDKKTLLIEVENLSLAYNKGLNITGPFSLNIPYGQKVCLLGENGVGKTLFLEALLGKKEYIASGKIAHGEKAVISGLKQIQQKLIQSDEDALSTFIKHVNKSEEEGIRYLKKAGFTEHTLRTKMSHLSPGQRVRFFIAVLISKGTHIIVLDEPTNHLDVESVEALEKAMSNFEGTIIAVTHDRKLIQNLNADVVYQVFSNKIEKIDDYESFITQSEKDGEKKAELVSRTIFNI